jgi:outer membrane autotransporter protein
MNVSPGNMVPWPIDIPVMVQSEVSRISAITLNGGVVNLQDDDIKAKYADYIGDLSKYKEHHKITIGELKGTGGIFKVDLDWNVNQGVNYGDSSYYSQSGSDYIYIENVDNTTKTNPVQIVDFDASKAHLENMKINEDKLYFANVKKGATSFITANSVYSNAGNVFDYTYGTGSKGTDWYIFVSGKSAESNPNFSAAKGAMYAGYALGTELDTLNKRMGEARYLEENDGVWVRYRHSKTGWDDTYETNGDMFQLGFDNEVTEKDGKHYRGVAVDYTDADTNIMGISGEGEHERYAVSLYDTWLGEKGHYRDLVLRGGRINSDYDVSGAFSNGYEDIGGDYHQWFGSISAEWGRKNDMGTGWYFEPQVQAQLARVGGASYVSDSGVGVDQDGATSLIGRAGFRIGREYVKDNGKHDNFYIKADLLHEFAGDKSFSLTGNDGRYDKEYDGQETWCDIGIGADISLGKNSYFWADVERTFDADFDNTWQINGGFRWEF